MTHPPQRSCLVSAAGMSSPAVNMTSSRQQQASLVAQATAGSPRISFSAFMCCIAEFRFMEEVALGVVEQIEPWSLSDL